MAALISKIRGAHNPAEADLRKTTESGILEIPEDLLDRVAEASRSEDDRLLIMKHLRECLSDMNGNRWKRVHAALVLAGSLVEKGSPELFSETARGVHFDIAQRVSLLEHYQPGSAADAQGKSKVRSKASEIRPALVARLQRTGEEEAVAAVAGGKGSTDLASNCSTGTGSTLSPPGGQLILNGIVAVGHCDDTTSESSGGEEARKAVQYRERRQTRKTRKERQADSEDSEDSAHGQRRKAGAGSNRGTKTASSMPPRSPAPAAAVGEQKTVDLLGF
jgi:hypothetical protein